jgi:predicted secreted protein
MAPEIRPPIYDRRLARLAEATGQVVRVEELTDY